MTIFRQVKNAAYKQLCGRHENSRECVNYNFNVTHRPSDIIGSKGRKKWELDEGMGFSHPLTVPSHYQRSCFTSHPQAGAGKRNVRRYTTHLAFHYNSMHNTGML